MEKKRKVVVGTVRWELRALEQVESGTLKKVLYKYETCNVKKEALGVQET